MSPDRVTVDFSITLPSPMDPPTSTSATIDGPPVTGVLPGTLVGIVSDPPGAGPTTGLLCVAVIVHAGAGVPFFGYVEPRIRVIDPFDNTIVVERSGLGMEMPQHSTRTYNIGPIVRNPWVALAVTVEEIAGDIITWEAVATSC